MRAESTGSISGGGWLRTRGHPLAVAAVRRAIDRSQAAHAWLFVGPRGVGKTTLALDLAAGLLCDQPDPQARPCRRCPACRKVEHGNHPDVHRIRPEGAGEQIRLPQVQSLVTDLALLPMEGRVRVAVIEAAHRLNPDAQNALLKTLEEPVGASCIVLCADDQATLLPTVVSRVTRFRLGPVPVAEVATLLVDVGAADPSRAALLARMSGGSPGVALALAGTPDSVIIGDRIARQLADLLAADRRTRLDSAAPLIADGAALETALVGATPTDATEVDTAGPGRPTSKRPAPAERRRAVRRVLTVWRDLGRDLGLVMSGARGRMRQLDLLEEMEAAAPAIDRASLVAFLDRLDGLHAAIDAYASPELVLDDLLLAWPRLSPPAARGTVVGVRPS